MIQRSMKFRVHNWRVREMFRVVVPFFRRHALILKKIRE